MIEAPVPVVPSPKFQATEYGAVPPVVVVVKVTSELMIGVDGRKVKLVAKGDGGTMVTVWELVAVWLGEDESVTVSVTVNDWTVAKV